MIDYRQSGVDTEEGYRAVEKYKEYAQRTRIPGVLTGLGNFAGMFEVPTGLKEPIMVSGTDGVGTKLAIAASLKKYDTVGIDCVAMSVNDILCTGARPLYFLDYIACGKLDSSIAADLVKGVANGCEQANCALLGGETAEMPGFYAEGDYDLAGFAVGIVEKAKIITGEYINDGDVLIGLASSGLHTNGFSLIRKLITDFSQDFDGTPIGDILLEPTRIYVQPVLSILEKFRMHGKESATKNHPVHGMVHITGGGFYENIPRMFTATNKHRAKDNKLPLTAVITKGSWSILPIFTDLIARGANPDRMYHTFNMGIGFILAVSATAAHDVCTAFNEYGIEAHPIGYVASSHTAIKSQEDAVLFR